MCSRYRLTASERVLLDHFDLEALEDVTLPTSDLFPKREGVVIVDQDGDRQARNMSWGFPPPPKGRAPVINVRNLTSLFWKGTLAKPKHRCLVPVTSFCEWEGEKGSKVARWFDVPEADVFAFAGIWRSTDASNVYAFLACEPNALVAPIHPKAMPVILDTDQYDAWLHAPYEVACELALPLNSNRMHVE